MNSLRSHLFVIGCILVGLCAPAWATNLPLGQTQTGTISSAAQSNSYTFSANAGEVLDVTMTATSGTLIPKIQLYNPAGQLIATATPPYCNSTITEMDTVTLLSTGTYTILVSDCSATNTGNYALYAQSTNDPSGAANLPFGGTEAGTIGLAAQSNTYTFSANANDVVDLTMTATSGSLIPKIRLYNPAGQLVSQANPPYCNSTITEMDAITLPSTGTYTVLVGDCSDTNAGNYELYAQRTNNPTGAANLPFGGTEAGTIGSAAQNNSYTFSANAGDVLDVTMTTTSGSLIPKIRLYNPAGELLSQANPPYCNSTITEMDTITLPSTGAYTVLVADCSDTNTGNYEIYGQRTENASGAKTLAFGSTKAGTISEAAQNNTYTFSANANDVVDFTMTRTSGSLIPKIRLYNPAGELVSQANPPYCNSTITEMDTITLPSTGTYTVLVADCSDTNTGKYEIYGQRTNKPSGAKKSTFGTTNAGTISAAAQNKTYTFSANANDVVDFTMTRTSGSLIPKIRLYNPAGGLVNQANPPYCNSTITEMNTITLPSTGTYTVLVGDCSDTNVGNYEIYGQRTNNPVGATGILWGQVQTGTIGEAAQSNTYTFIGIANDTVDFTMVSTSGSLIPKIRLYNPAGGLVSQANPPYCNSTVTEMNGVTLSSTGTYTVLLGDCSDTNTGNYNLSSECFGTCPVSTTTTLSSSPNPSTYGQAVTLNAVVAPAPPDGETVVFMKGKTVLGTGTLSNGSASFTTSKLKVGTNSITAVYAGDSNFYTSTSKAVSEVVSKATTTTALTSSQNPSNVGQSVTFTASVTPQFSGTPTGSVTFDDGTTTLKTVPLSGGAAKFTTSTLTSGSHTITATYSGSTSFTSSSASLTQTVN